MNANKNLCGGYDWSLTRFETTEMALEAESIFNKRVLSEGLCSNWTVGQAVVKGPLRELPKKDLLNTWREEAIAEAIRIKDWRMKHLAPVGG